MKKILAQQQRPESAALFVGGPDFELIRQGEGKAALVDPIRPKKLPRRVRGLERLVKVLRRLLVQVEEFLAQGTFLAARAAGAFLIFDDDAEPLPKGQRYTSFPNAYSASRRSVPVLLLRR